MFGYITPLKDELKVGEYTDFKSYYCGLCQHLKSRFGELPRLVLNYDLTTLALLLDGLSPHSTYRTHQPCITNPIKRKPMIISNRALSYAAAMNVSLAYYKLCDDVSDDNNLRSLTFSYVLKPYIKKFSPKERLIHTAIATQLQALALLESRGDFDTLDAISHPSAMIVGLILKHYPHPLFEDSPRLRQQLFDFGYALGKWIYLIDALDDLEKDLKSKAFNPILTLYPKGSMDDETFMQSIREPLSFAILSAGATCSEHFKTLPIQRNHSILNNIIHLGMMHQYNKVLSSTCCTTCASHKRG